MEMVYFHKTLLLSLISFALVLASAFPSAPSHDKSEKENHDDFNTYVNAAYNSIDLARGKGIEIQNLLKSLRGKSDHRIQLCLSNYDAAISDIDKGKIHLDSGKYGTCYYISTPFHDALNDFNDCRHAFDGTSDPHHISGKNQEFFAYVQNAYAATKKVDDVSGFCHELMGK